MLQQADPYRVTITKKRQRFIWKGQFFQIDTFQDPVSNLVMMETKGISEQIATVLEENLMTVIPEITEVRPQTLECDVVRFQNNKEKWVALVGLLDGYPYEIFTGLQDDEEGIILPKNVVHGKIIKQVNLDGTKRYDFQFENKRGYKTTVAGLSEKFNPEYWN